MRPEANEPQPTPTSAPMSATISRASEAMTCTPRGCLRPPTSRATHGKDHGELRSTVRTAWTTHLIARGVGLAKFCGDRPARSYDNDFAISLHQRGRRPRSDRRRRIRAAPQRRPRWFRPTDVPTVLAPCSVLSSCRKWRKSERRLRCTSRWHLKRPPSVGSRETIRRDNNVECLTKVMVGRLPVKSTCKFRASMSPDAVELLLLRHCKWTSYCFDVIDAFAVEVECDEYWRRWVEWRYVRASSISSASLRGRRPPRRVHRPRLALSWCGGPDARQGSG